MEVLLLIADITAMFLLVRWSAQSESSTPKMSTPDSLQRRPPTRPAIK